MYIYIYIAGKLQDRIVALCAYTQRTVNHLISKPMIDVRSHTITAHQHMHHSIWHQSLTSMRCGQSLY